MNNYNDFNTHHQFFADAQKTVVPAYLHITRNINRLNACPSAKLGMNLVSGVPNISCGIWWMNIDRNGTWAHMGLISV